MVPRCFASADDVQALSTSMPMLQSLSVYGGDGWDLTPALVNFPWSGVSMPLPPHLVITPYYKYRYGAGEEQDTSIFRSANVLSQTARLQYRSNDVSVGSVSVLCQPQLSCYLRFLYLNPRPEQLLPIIGWAGFSFSFITSYNNGGVRVRDSMYFAFITPSLDGVI